MYLSLTPAKYLAILFMALSIFSGWVTIIHAHTLKSLVYDLITLKVVTIYNFLSYLFSLIVFALFLYSILFILKVYMNRKLQKHTTSIIFNQILINFFSLIFGILSIVVSGQADVADHWDPIIFYFVFFVVIVFKLVKLNTFIVFIFYLSVVGIAYTNYKQAVDRFDLAFEERIKPATAVVAEIIEFDNILNDKDMFIYDEDFNLHWLQFITNHRNSFYMINKNYLDVPLSIAVSPFINERFELWEAKQTPLTPLSLVMMIRRVLEKGGRVYCMQMMLDQKSNVWTETRLKEFKKALMSLYREKGKVYTFPSSGLEIIELRAR